MGRQFGSIGFFVIQVFAANSGVRQHRDAVGLHLKNAASDEHKLLAAVGHVNAHRACLDARDQWRVARVNAQLARLTRQRNKARFARKNRLFGTNHVDVNGVHGFSLGRLGGLNLLGLLEGFIDVANHVEGLLGQVIALARHNHLETSNGFSQTDIFAR